MSKTKVIYHRADYDGLFCREIARKFLPDAELIGWDFGDAQLEIPSCGIYVMDLPLDAPFGFKYKAGDTTPPQHPAELVWIDHHKSSIETHPEAIPGYRIDGVSACRLAYQYFTHDIANKVMSDAAYLPKKQEFIDRSVSEPMAVRLAGEYDIWDHRGDGDVEFQFGLDATKEIPWDVILDIEHPDCRAETGRILNRGEAAMNCYAKRDADVMRDRSFTVRFEGLEFLALNTPRCNSNTFAALDKPQSGHDALMAFYYNGKGWSFSLYHANHRKDLDLSTIAVKYGGGGHRGACGFRVSTLKDFPILT